MNPEAGPFKNPGLTDPCGVRWAACLSQIRHESAWTFRYLSLLGCMTDRTATLPASDDCHRRASQRARTIFPRTTTSRSFFFPFKDSITKGNWAFNLGFVALSKRLTGCGEFQPRLGVAYT